MRGCGRLGAQRIEYTARQCVRICVVKPPHCVLQLTLICTGPHERLRAAAVNRQVGSRLDLHVNGLLRTQQCVAPQCVTTELLQRRDLIRSKQL